MANTLDSKTSPDSRAAAGQPSGWSRLGFLAAASVFAGGLAAAWWYRNTLKKLRQAEEIPSNPHFGIPGADPEDEG
jgi:hypothetical protein